MATATYICSLCSSPAPRCPPTGTLNLLSAIASAAAGGGGGGGGSAGAGAGGSGWDVGEGDAGVGVSGYLPLEEEEEDRYCDPAAPPRTPTHFRGVTYFHCRYCKYATKHKHHVKSHEAVSDEPGGGGRSAIEAMSFRKLTKWICWYEPTFRVLEHIWRVCGGI